MIYGYKRRKIITLPSDLLDTIESFAYSRNLSVSEMIGIIAVAYDPNGIDEDCKAYDEYDKSKLREYEAFRDKQLADEMMNGYI